MELKDGVRPFHAKTYFVPQAILLVLKKKVNRLVDIRVLSPNLNLEWSDPLFAIPKKNRQILFVTNFCQVNKRTKSKPYPQLHMGDLLESLESMTYAITIVLSMGYYHMHPMK